MNLSFFFREKFLVGKKCRFHCSWKLVALALTLLTLILSSVIAYFGGKLLNFKELTMPVRCVKQHHIVVTLDKNTLQDFWCRIVFSVSLVCEKELNLIAAVLIISGMRLMPLPDWNVR